MNRYDYDREAIEWYYRRRRKYMELGYNAYADAEFVASLAEPVEGTLLEVGTGRGLLTTYLAKKTPVTTVDIDAEILDFAREMAKARGCYDRITFEQRDILTNPYQDNAFNVVVSANAYHHFDEPLGMAAAMCATAKDKIIIADFTEEGYDIISRMHLMESRIDHDRGKIPIEEAGEIIEGAGFKVERVEKHHTVAYIGKKN